MAFVVKCKPCEYTAISQPYKAGRHRGIDLVNHNLYQKTPIVAVSDGTVVAASRGAWDRSYGNMVAIYHGNGTYTNYAHLSKIKVKVGQKVKAGTTIGLMGNTGNSTGTHLHFEVHKGRKWNRVNPYTYIKGVPTAKNMPKTTTITTSAPKSSFEKGHTYTLCDNMSIRISAGADKPKVPMSKWTADAKKHATKDGLLKKGTKVTCQGTEKYNGGIWMRTPSGWICAVGSTGTVFIK